jgi:hypothetical protein
MVVVRSTRAFTTGSTLRTMHYISDELRTIMELWDPQAQAAYLLRFQQVSLEALCTAD